MADRLSPFRDLDHVVMQDGRIYRVLGNLQSQSVFLGYNVYSPDENGDRIRQGRRFKKNFIEDEDLPTDVFDTYDLLPVHRVIEHHEPVQAAMSMSRTFKSSIWYSLYTKLGELFGPAAVGIFGSSMFGFHLTPSGTVRKDVDFVIEGIENIEILRHRLPELREALGFSPVSTERQERQYARYQRIFRNENNTIRPIIARRWAGLQLSEDVVTTLRVRDSAVSMPVELVSHPKGHNGDVARSGKVTHADGSNLFPRRFTLVTPEGHQTEVYIFWWKFSTPVREGDQVTLCGSLLDIEGRPVIRMTNFARHWLKIDGDESKDREHGTC